MNVTYRIAGLLYILLLASCASTIPATIRQAPADNPLLSEVRNDTAQFESKTVRWGGEILAIDNQENTTALTILARPLSKSGKPRSTDSSPGRFIAHIPAFLEPKVYTAGRNVTVVGTLAGTEKHPVGEHDYTYPVVKATDWFLWPKAVQYPSDYYDPWFYDPWYYYPWYPYPRLHHHHH